MATGPSCRTSSKKSSSVHQMTQGGTHLPRPLVARKPVNRLFNLFHNCPYGIIITHVSIYHALSGTKEIFYPSFYWNRKHLCMNISTCSVDISANRIPIKHFSTKDRMLISSIICMCLASSIVYLINNASLSRNNCF